MGAAMGGLLLSLDHKAKIRVFLPRKAKKSEVHSLRFSVSAPLGALKNNCLVHYELSSYSASVFLLFYLNEQTVYTPIGVKTVILVRRVPLKPSLQS